MPNPGQQRPIVRSRRSEMVLDGADPHGFTYWRWFWRDSSRIGSGPTLRFSPTAASSLCGEGGEAGAGVR